MSGSRLEPRGTRRRSGSPGNRQVEPLEPPPPGPQGALADDSLRALARRSGGGLPGDFGTLVRTPGQGAAGASARGPSPRARRLTRDRGRWADRSSRGRPTARPGGWRDRWRALTSRRIPTLAP